MSAAEIPRIGVAPLTPDQEVIDTAEDLLRQARSGELRGLAYISYLTDSNTGYGLRGAYTKSNYLRTYGMLHWLAARAMKRWDELSEEVQP